MFGLRQKLLLGLGGLLVILLLVSGLGVAVLRQHRSDLDRFLDENWRSVQYGQAMIDDLERLDDAAAHGVPASAAKSLADFDANLDAEDHNITLPHEDEFAGSLTRLWNGIDLKTGASATLDCYRAAYKKLQAKPD